MCKRHYNNYLGSCSVGCGDSSACCRQLSCIPLWHGPRPKEVAHPRLCLLSEGLVASSDWSGQRCKDLPPCSDWDICRHSSSRVPREIIWHFCCNCRAMHFPLPNPSVSYTCFNLLGSFSINLLYCKYQSLRIYFPRKPIWNSWFSYLICQTIL